MTLRKIIELLEGEIILNTEDLDTTIDSVCSSDLMSDLLHFQSKTKALLITGLNNTQVIRTAEIADLKVIVFVLDKRPDKDTTEMARQKGVQLIVTRLSRFTACGRLYEAGLRSCTGEHR